MRGGVTAPPSPRPALFPTILPGLRLPVPAVALAVRQVAAGRQTHQVPVDPLEDLVDLSVAVLALGVG